MEITSIGVQVHGGMGFVEETGAAQHMRDARILPIYEGTNGIQALDFVGRKCLKDGGEGLKELIQRMNATIDLYEASSDRVKRLLESLGECVDECNDGLNHVLDNPNKSSYVAYNFMMLFGNAVSYWLLVKLAMAAQAKIDEGYGDRFFHQKIATAEFFASQLLTRNAGYLGSVLGSVDNFDVFSVEDFYRA
jgi:hypothetical protein